jgi:hypothetical protein
MPAAPAAEFVAFGPWVEALLDRHAVEIRSRGLALQCEFDSDFVVETSESLEAAMRALLQLILATVPDDCEVYLAGARSDAPVSNPGAGRISARWQVPGSQGVDAESMPKPLFPLTGDAQRHAKSELAARVQRGFAAAQWRFALEILNAGRELLAHAERR